MTETTAHIVVSGMVQGVGFRYFAYSHATKLRLTGYVKNLYSGDVEIIAQGDRSLVEEFIREVKVGPRHADVKDVKVEYGPVDHRYREFQIQG